MAIAQRPNYCLLLRNNLQALCKIFLALVSLVGALLSPTALAEVETMEIAEANLAGSQRFSFNEPSTFRYGTDEQKATLRSISEQEFSLAHLTQEDQDLLNEALRYSGVEVHHTCVIDRVTSAGIRAFLGRWNPDEHARYHPLHGSKMLNGTEDAQQDEPEWTTIATDFSEYPYPFSEAQVLPKAVPIDLSSIQPKDRSNTSVVFTGYPSRLLVEQVGEDNIVEREDLAVDIEVDLQSRRVLSTALYLPKPVRVHRGISLRELSITYKFENDAVSNRNVLISMHQTMKGRIWLLVRPKLTVDTDLSYVECFAETADQSYLYRSIDAIAALEQGTVD